MSECDPQASVTRMDGGGGETLRTALPRGPNRGCQNHTFTPRTGSDLNPTTQSFLFDATKYIHNRQCEYDVTMRRVRVTIVAVEKH